MVNQVALNIIDGAEIPSVPHVLQEILKLTNDPSSSSQDMEKLILQEPGLVTHLLKTVNSAYYSLQKEVTSINHAIVLLGFVAVRSIVSGLAFIDAFNNIPGLNQDYVLKVWKHSLASAGIVKLIAKEASRNKKDDLFLAAMVQNVGHLILSQYYQEEYDALTGEEAFPTLAAEQAKFEVDHAQVGTELLRAWKFPGKIIDLVQSHHDGATYRGEETDRQYLTAANLLAAKNEDLGAFLTLEEGAVETGLIEQLVAVSWSWEDIQEEQERFIDSVEMAQQIIAG